MQLSLIHKVSFIFLALTSTTGTYPNEWWKQNQLQFNIQEKQHKRWKNLKESTEGNKEKSYSKNVFIEQEPGDDETGSE